MKSVKTLLFTALLGCYSLLKLGYDKLLRDTPLGRLLSPLGKVACFCLSALWPEQDCQLSVNGYRLLLPCKTPGNQEDMHTFSIILTGTYEPYTTMLFKQFVREGMTVMDIGAHIGYFTLLASRLVGDSGKVFAFEPEPRNYSFLLRNIALNGCNNVVAVQKAVLDRTAQVRLYVSRSSSGWHTLGKVWQRDCSECIEVGGVSIDEFLRDSVRYVDVIKIDVEGAEVQVLRGMTETCRTSDNLKVFIEFSPLNLGQFGTDPEEYWNRLIELGFKHIFIIDESNQQLRPADLQAAVSIIKKNRVESVNLLCSKSPYCAV